MWAILACIVALLSADTVCNDIIKKGCQVIML